MRDHGPPPTDEVRLGPIFRAGWWIVLLGAVCGVVAGALVANLVGERRTVTVEILVKPLTSDPAARPSMDNEARVLASDAVLSAAQASLADHPSLEELRKVAVDAFPGSTVLQIRVTSDAAKVSRERAAAIASSYLANRADEARRANDGLKAGVRLQLDSARADLARAQGDERTLVGRVNELQGRLDELDRFVPDPGTVLRGPSAPSFSGPPAALTVVGVSMVGIVIGLAAATLRARRR